MVKGTYKFRAVGPGLDFAEWGDASDLDGILQRLTLVVQKFKRDASRAQSTAAVDPNAESLEVSGE